MFEWKELFIPTIFERGKGLSLSDISNVSISKKGLIAKIQGTEKYELQIPTGLDWMTCSCPFAQNNGLACKHMAALLIYCENNWTSEMAEFFKNSEISPLGQQATRQKIKRLEKEQEKERKKVEQVEKERNAFEWGQDWLRTDPQRQAERAEQFRLAEERKKRKAIKEEEKRKRREERERKRWEKQKAEEERLKKLEEERRLAEERAKKQREEWEVLRKKEQEEHDRILANGTERKKREAEKNYIKKDRNWSSEFCRDIENETKLQSYYFLSKTKQKEALLEYIKERFGDNTPTDDVFLAIMQEEFIEELINQDNMIRLKKTGWYYPD